MTYWYMFPIAITIATIAMTAGIGGAAMFSPLFLLLLRLPVSVVVGLGLFIEIFGFGSGLIGYTRKDLIAWPVGINMLFVTLPIAMLGAGASLWIPSNVIVMTIALLLLSLAWDLLRHNKQIIVKHPAFHETCKDTAKDHLCYDAVHMNKWFYLLTGLGAFLVGLASIGLGEVNEYNFLKRLRMHSSLASGTSVFVVACTATIAALFHGYLFLQSADSTVWKQVGSILLFTAPGVIIGGQIGVRFSQKIPRKNMQTFVGGLFVILALLIVLKMLFV